MKQIIRIINKIKKVNKRYIAIFLCFVVSCLLLPKIETLATEETEKIQYKDTINILEIGPGDVFVLNKNQTSITVGGKDYATNITQMDMPTYISKVDDIAGKYDAVVISRKGKYNSIGNSENGEQESIPKFRDYTNPFSLDQKGDITPSELPLYNMRYNEVEYYSENDITKKRAKEIVNMINANELVYMDNNIVKDTSIKDTYLYKLGNYTNGGVDNPFNTMIKAGDNNFKREDQSVITLENIIKDYLALKKENTKPYLAEITKPLDDKALYLTEEGYKNKGSLEKRNMSFDALVKNEKGNNLTFKLYLDLNADGLFKDNEVVSSEKIEQINSNEYKYNFKYKLDNDFVGYLNWKIEVVRDNGVKTSEVSSSQFKALTNSRGIRVLQIYPEYNSDYLYLGKDPNNSNVVVNSKFSQLVNKINSIGDYSLNIESCSLQYFNSKIKDGSLTLNGKYDMIIIGFADDYAKKEFDAKAVDKLKEFVGTGQGVMFTHDTMTRILSDASQPRGGKNLTKAFRDSVGQARYVDPFNTTQKDIYKVENNNGELEDRIIPHEVLNSTNTNSYSTGTTLTHGYWGVANTSQIVSVNDSQITGYPFSLESTTGEQKVIPVATTHSQWYQLNLEDEDVVPWYNLTNNNINSGDSRNFYYTYSKGNITYSGTGHSNTYTDTEMELFVNTIIKAERGSNHSPKATSYYMDGNEKKIASTVDNIITTASNDFKFSTVVKDLDYDKVTVSIKVDGVEQLNKVVNSGEEAALPAISKDILLDKAKNNKTISINVTVTDSQGARSEKNYTVSVNEELPNIEATLTSSKNVQTKVGVENKVTYKVDAKNFSNPYGNESTISNDTVILFDTSKSMKNDSSGDSVPEVLNALEDKFLQANDTPKYKYAMLTYDAEGVNTLADFNTVDQNGSSKGAIRLLFQEKQKDLFTTNNEKGNSITALSTAINLIASKGNDGSRKNIVFITSGVEKEYEKKQLEEITKSIKALNINLITLKLDLYNVKDSITENFHKNISGDVDGKKYIAAKFYKVNNEFLRTIKDSMTNVSDNINWRAAQEFVTNAKLTFNLNNNFEVVGNNNGDSNTYTVDLGQIKYKLGENSTQYVTDWQSKEISFTVKPKKIGVLDFGYSTLVYEKFLGGTITKTLVTPTFYVLGIEHGVFKSFDGTQGKAILEDNNNSLAFADGATVQFAANILNVCSGQKIVVNLDPNCEIKGTPTIYKVINGKLVDPVAMLKTEAGYEYTPGSNATINSNMVLLYNIKLKHPSGVDSYTYNNKVTFIDGTTVDERIASVMTNKNTKLPDLF